jgi:OmpA-OmpF porin, OOP family
MRFKAFLFAAVLVLGAVPAPALSQAGWYVGLGAGRLKTGDECPTGAAPGASCEDEDTAWKLFGGYQFNPYLGYELAIADMGQRSASLSGIGVVTARFRFFETVLTGTLPMGQRLSAYAKAGIFAWDIDYDLPPGFIGSADSNGNDYTFGLGVKYRFTRSFALRLEWQRYNDVGEPTTTGRFNADTFGIGALLSF